MSETNGGTPEPINGKSGLEPVTEQLARLLSQISQQTDRLTAGVRTTVEAAREIGLRLTEAKKLLSGTGTGFKGWVRGNCRFSYITACRYVRLAEHWDRFTERQKGTLSIPELLDQVAGHRRRRADRKPEVGHSVVQDAAATPSPRYSPDATDSGEGHGTDGAVGPVAVTQPAAGGGGPITVTHAEVRQAAEKHGLGMLLNQVPPHHLLGFLADLGIAVRPGPVRAVA